MVSFDGTKGGVVGGFRHADFITASGSSNQRSTSFSRSQLKFSRSFTRAFSDQSGIMFFSSVIS